MGIAFVAASRTNANYIGVTTMDLTISVGSGETLMASIMATVASLGSVVWDPAGVNQALTVKDTSIINGAYYTFVAGILNPTAGASKTLRVTMASGNGGMCAGTYSGSGIAYGNTGHDDQNTDTPVTWAPANANANAWIILAGTNQSAGPVGAGTGSNMRGAADFFTTIGLFDSGNKATAGTQSMGMTHSAGFSHSSAAWVELYESGGGGGGGTSEVVIDGNVTRGVGRGVGRGVAKAPIKMVRKDRIFVPERVVSGQPLYLPRAA